MIAFGERGWRGKTSLHRPTNPFPATLVAVVVVVVVVVV